MTWAAQHPSVFYLISFSISRKFFAMTSQVHLVYMPAQIKVGVLPDMQTAGGEHHAVAGDKAHIADAEGVDIKGLRYSR